MMGIGAVTYTVQWRMGGWQRVALCAPGNPTLVGSVLDSIFPLVLDNRLPSCHRRLYHSSCYAYCTKVQGKLSKRIMGRE